MSMIRTLLVSACVTLVVLVGTAVGAQGGAAQTEEGAQPSRPASKGVDPQASTADFRGRIMFAYGSVVGAIILYLVASHRRNAGLREEIGFLRKRLDELKRNS